MVVVGVGGGHEREGGRERERERESQRARESKHGLPAAKDGDAPSYGHSLN